VWKARTSLARTTLRTLVPKSRRSPDRALGFFGVLDERLDFALLAQVARERPNGRFAWSGRW